MHISVCVCGCVYLTVFVCVLCVCMSLFVCVVCDMLCFHVLCVSAVVQSIGWFAALYMFLGDTIPEQHRWMKAALYAIMSILVLQLLVENQWMWRDEQQQAREQIRLTVGVASGEQHSMAHHEYHIVNITHDTSITITGAHYVCSLCAAWKHLMSSLSAPVLSCAVVLCCALFHLQLQSVDAVCLLHALFRASVSWR